MPPQAKKQPWKKAARISAAIEIRYVWIANYVGHCKKTIIEISELIKEIQQYNQENCGS